MKKNKMMRLASFLLVCVLLTTSVISGTFAKYITSDSASDTARVAKWGVEITADKDIFLSQYETHDEEEDGFGYDETFSVKTASTEEDAEDDHLVAPGTNGAFTFSITGAPEVAVNVAVSFSGNPEDDADDLKMIEIPVNTVVGKDANGEDVETTEAYNPIKWTLKRSDEEVDDWDDVDAIEELKRVTLADIEAYFAEISVNYDPNTNLAGEFGYYQLSWEWDYQVDAGTDMLDTYLGNNTENQEESFNLSIVVTQID